MSIRVLDTVTGSTLTFPMDPDKISFKSATKFMDYELMNVGDVKIPFGEELSEVSFQAILPGSRRLGSGWIRSWRSPREIQGLFSVWRNKGRKLRLTIDGTPIDHGMYLQNYEAEYSGGFGDYTCAVTFIAAKDVVVNVEAKKETEVEEEATTETETTKKETSSKKSSSSKNRTYKVKKGDTLWGIAQKYYGKGSLYPKIQKANGISGDLIFPGQVLKIP